jgi:alkylation response protein AidB-like acyl-CoA dehydrogenase
MADTPPSPFVSAVREIGPAFADRAAPSDQSGSFAAANYQELKARKLISAGVPKDLGGGGATHAELCDMLREMAHFCPSTALALSMHTHLLAGAVWRHLQGQPTAPLLSKVAQGELVLVSTGAADWLDSTGAAERVEGGYRVTAQKRFASGCPGGDMAMSSAPFDDPTDGPIVFHFAVSLKSEGVRINDDWDTLGMRATGSNTITFDKVFVPDAAVSAKRPRGKWHPSFNLVCIVATPIFFSAYLGLAEKAAELAREGAKKRPMDPHLPYQIGEMENALVTAQMAWRETVTAANNYDFAPEIERANRTLICKSIGAEAVQRCVQKAVESTGGGAFYRKHPLEKLWRDVQAVQFHPMPRMKQLVFSGRVAMGLSPI